MSCALCDGELVLLGQLGSIEHYRCTCCGMGQSLDSDKDTTETN